MAVRGPRGEKGEAGAPGRDASQLPELDQHKDRFNKESKLDIRKPEPFTGQDRSKWEPYLSQIRRLFNAKPTTYEEDRDKISLAASYLTEAAGTHYDNLVIRAESGEEVLPLVYWTEFVKEFTSKFGIFDVARDAQTNLSWITQQPNESFAKFIIRFQQYAFKTGFNDEALVFKLRESVHANLDILVASQQQRPRSYDEWVDRFQELDSSVRATQEAHRRGGYRSGGNPIPGFTQPVQYNRGQNQWAGNFQNNRAGGQGDQSRTQGGWKDRQRGSAAWGAEQGNLAATVEGPSTNYGEINPQDLAVGNNLADHNCNCGELADFDGEALLRAGIVRTPEQLEEFRRRRREKLCYRCGGKDHIGRECKNPEDLNPKKGGPEGDSTHTKNGNSEREKLRAAIFSIEEVQNEGDDWNVQILEDQDELNESGNGQGAPARD